MDAEHAKYESETIGAMVDGQEVTIATLREAFDAVANDGDWKSAWAAWVPASAVPLIVESVRFFHADTPKVVGGPQPLTGRVLMEGTGYQAW